jgi:hypothetical protein
MAFLGLACALWRRKLITRFIVPVGFLAYGLNRFVWPGPCPPAARLQEGPPLLALVFVVGILFAVLALNVASGRAYFRPVGKRTP